MIFSNIGMQNVLNPDFNGLQFSVIGMVLVFCGLIIIAVYIILLPKILQLAAGKNTKSQKTGQGNAQEEEILLAIAAAYHLHSNFPAGEEKITWKSHGDMESPWLVSGRMHSLHSRKFPTSWTGR